MNKLRTWIRDTWWAIHFLYGLRRKREEQLRGLCAKLREQVTNLAEIAVRAEADRRTMRDRIVEHMAREQELHNEISSLRRHLSMAIDERDQARKRKRS